MFENIVLRRSPEQSSPIDPGLLAEALLFYQNVHIILDYASLNSLIKNIGIESLFTIIENDWAKATYFMNSLGTHTHTHGVQVHEFGTFELIGSEKAGIKRGKQKRIDFIFERALGKSRETNKVAKKFSNLVPVTTLERQFKESGGITELANLDLQDSNFVKRSIDIILKELIPDIELPSNWHFEIIKLEKGFVVDTNLDFTQLNSQYHKRIPKEHNSISEAYLTNHILEARADLCFASNYMAEYTTNSISSNIMMMKFPQILSKRYSNANQIELFQTIHMDDGKALRETINSKRKSFDDFLNILDKANKFKEWLKEVHPDQNLLSEYYKAVTSQSWIDKLPPKILRFIVSTGIGLVADPVSAASASMADSFILDRFLKGWRPHHFIEGQMKEFTEQ
ncbi:MAG: hypothetical protein IIA72_07420 [Proteobacteria bacterium]|nr:hypothetical protein [Pseudomonadota bacterium]